MHHIGSARWPLAASSQVFRSNFITSRRFLRVTQAQITSLRAHALPPGDEVEATEEKANIVFIHPGPHARHALKSNASRAQKLSAHGLNWGLKDEKLFATQDEYK